jgi:hypothetical protein
MNNQEIKLNCCQINRTLLNIRNSLFEELDKLKTKDSQLFKENGEGQEVVFGYRKTASMLLWSLKERGQLCRDCDKIYELSKKQMN